MTSTPSSRSASASSSPSKSSSVSFSLNSKGCILGILNRILRFRSLSTYPSDQLFESYSDFQELEEVKQSKQSSLVSPSIVARLMGLDTIPTNTPIQSPGSITRTFSDPNQEQCRHRRVKSSSRCSVSEMNGFFEFENDDFLVLSFAESKKKSSKSKKKKPEDGIVNSDEVFESEEVEFRKRRRRRKKRKNITKKKKKKTRVEDECSPEESSPVSVLDFDQFLTDHDVHRSELGTEPISRRRLSSELEASGFQLQSTIRRMDTNLIENRICEVEILNEICKMAGDEIAESTWFSRESKSVLKRQEDYEEICVDLESQIVDFCLIELVQELVEPT